MNLCESPRHLDIFPWATASSVQARLPRHQLRRPEAKNWKFLKEPSFKNNKTTHIIYIFLKKLLITILCPPFQFQIRGARQTGLHQPTRLQVSQNSAKPIWSFMPSCRMPYPSRIKQTSSIGAVWRKQCPSCTELVWSKALPVPCRTRCRIEMSPFFSADSAWTFGIWGCKALLVSVSEDIRSFIEESCCGYPGPKSGSASKRANYFCILNDEWC